MKKSLLVLMGLCMYLTVWSQVTTTVELKQSGTLMDLLTDSEIERTEKIVIRGNALDANDFAVLQAMIVRYNLKEVDIENTSTFVITNRAFEGCANLQSIKLPKYLTDTGFLGFYDCSGLIEIELPSTVEKIPHSFRGCSSLTSITLGRNVTSIEGQSFYLCYNLKEVHCMSSTPPDCEVGAFEDTHEDLTLYVPEECSRKYSLSSGWSNFANIKEEYVEPACHVTVTLTEGWAFQTYPFYDGGGGLIVTNIYPDDEYKLQFEKGDMCHIFIEPNRFSTNNEINQILFDGEDITSQLIEHIISFEVTKDCKLEIIVKEKNTTANETLTNKSIKVSSFDNTIVVLNAEQGERVAVYDMLGKLISTTITNSERCEMQVPNNKLYIVKVGDETFKIAM